MPKKSTGPHPAKNGLIYPFSPMDVNMEMSHQKVNAMTMEAMMFKILLLRRILMANVIP